MPDEKDKLVKPPDPTSGPSGTLAKPGGAVKITGKSRLHSALAASGGVKVDPEESFKKAAAEAAKSAIDKVDDPNTALNRIAIMADVSGSMGSCDGSRQTKIELLKMALGGFIQQINPDTTSVAIYTFPLGYERFDEDDDYGSVTASAGVAHGLSRDKNLLQMTVNGLRDSGGTPMHSTMSKVISEVSLTRGIIISDGEADSPDRALEQARNFAKSETIVDCVHIGSSGAGERLLSEIARICGGLYLKFDNVENFSKAFSFLSPENRAKLALAAGPNASLAEKAEVAKLLGAKEIK